MSQTVVHTHEFVESHDEFYEYVSCNSCPKVWKRKVYGKCYECNEPMPTHEDGWHHNNKKYENGTMSCWEYHKFNEICDEECK